MILLARNVLYYDIGCKFGKRKVWQICQILQNRQTLFAKQYAIQLLPHSAMVKALSQRFLCIICIHLINND